MLSVEIEGYQGQLKIMEKLVNGMKFQKIQRIPKTLDVQPSGAGGLAFFLYLMVSYVYAKGDNDSFCSNLSSAMRNGVNSTTFDLFDEDPGWSRSPLLQYTCRYGTTWTDSINKVAYSIPDEFAQAPISIPDDVPQHEFRQSTHTKEVKNVMAKSIHLGLLNGMSPSTPTSTDAFNVSTAEFCLSDDATAVAFYEQFSPFEF